MKRGLDLTKFCSEKQHLKWRTSNRRVDPGLFLFHRILFFFSDNNYSYRKNCRIWQDRKAAKRTKKRKQTDRKIVPERKYVFILVVGLCGKNVRNVLVQGCANQKCNLEYERERWISYQDGIRNLQKQRTNDPTLKQKTNQKIYLIFNRGHPGQCDQIGWFIVLCNKWLGTLS